MSGYLIDSLKELIDERVISFHVPGHKNGILIKKYYEKYISNIFEIDTTEIPGTDNLHHPVGAIQNSQERISRIYNSEKSYILVNGTTCGILSMILASTKAGDKILMGRNSHKSVFNSVLIGKLEPVFFNQELDINTGIFLDIKPAILEDQIIRNPDIGVILITYPTYNGICSDIYKIYDIAKKYDKILLVDEAHGAHLILSEKLPQSSINYKVDGVVQSSHKSLPSLTQSSVLHINSDRISRAKLEMLLSIFQSSSPSYLLMSSIDVAMEIVENEGRKLMEELLENISWFKNNIHEKTNFLVIDNKFLGFEKVYDMDPTKINIFPNNEGYRGNELEELLRKEFSIQVEFSTDTNLLLVTSIGNSKEDFEKLLDALISLSGLKNAIELEKIEHKTFELERKYSISEAFDFEGNMVELKNSVGKVTLDFIIPYPPGVPIATPGEVLSEEVVNYVLDQSVKGYSITGIHDKFLKNIRIL